MPMRNLATRPFYNTRAVHAVLLAALLLVAAASAFDAWEYWHLRGTQAHLQAQIDSAQRRSQDLRTRATSIRSSINAVDLDRTIATVEEANTLIGRRVFSWTELFNHLETTLPETVRITAVRPRMDRAEGLSVAVVVVARSVEGINTFIEQLEKANAFSGLLSRDEFVKEDGTIQATLEGRYMPAVARPAIRNGSAGR